VGCTNLGGIDSWLMANGTSCDYLMNVSSHCRPIKVLSQDVNGLVKAKMTS